MEKSQNNQKKGDKCLKAVMDRITVPRRKTFGLLFFLQLRRKRRKHVIVSCDQSGETLRAAPTLLVLKREVTGWQEFFFSYESF